MTQEALILADAIAPALAMLPAKMTSREARVALLAIGLQESRLIDRVQMGNGPARGLWQFERGGGARGVLNCPATAKLATQVCAAREVDATPAAVWAELPHDDILAAAFARLLLFSDPLALQLDDIATWGLYLRTWRPGRPRPEKWAANYRRAIAAVPTERHP